MHSRAPLMLGMVVGLFLGLDGAWWLLSISFDESRTMTRYSLDSLVLIPTIIRDVPEIDVVGEVTFHSSCGDGPKPPSEAILYASSRTAADLDAELRAFFVSRGYVTVDDELRGPEGDIVDVTVIDDGKVRHVEVRLYP